MLVPTAPSFTPVPIDRQTRHQWYLVRMFNGRLLQRALAILRRFLAQDGCASGLVERGDIRPFLELD